MKLRVGIVAGVVGLLLAGQAQAEVMRITPPKIDYAKVCKWESRELPEMKEPDDKLSPSAAYRRAQFVMTGNLDTRPDPLRAEKLYRRAMQDPKIKGKAQVQLGRLLTTLDNGGNITRRREGIKLLEGVTGEAADNAARYYWLANAYRNEGRGEMAAEYFRKAYAAGQGRAVLTLVDMYKNGEVALPTPDAVEKTMQLAQRWLLEQLGSGKCDAIQHIARFYFSDKYGIEDKDLGIEWFKVGVEAGDPNSINNLAHMYDNGSYLAIDRERAMELWKRAAELGSADAMYEWGERRLLAGKTKEEREEAVAWLVKAATRENLDAAVLLAKFYLGNAGGEVNYNKAFIWLDKLSSNVNTEGALIYELGELYEAGRGTERNLEKAFQYYQIAAEKGHGIATKKIGDFYAMGLGVEANPVKSYRYYRLAASRGNANAMRTLAEHYECGLGKKANAEIAQRWWDRALKAGDWQTLQVRTNQLLNNPTPENIREAIKLLRRAALDNKRKVMVWLARIYDEGLGGVEKDSNKVAYWRDRAIAPGEGIGDGYLALAREEKFMGSAKGQEFLQEAANRGNKEAMYMLARQLMVNEREKALKLLEEAGNTGHIGSLKLLAKIDLPNKVKWLEKAASYGNNRSIMALAQEHKRLGNAADSEVWFKKLEAQPICDMEDYFMLARAYMDGSLTEKNEQKAHGMFLKLIEQGNPAAMRELGKLKLQDNSVEAIEMLKKAAELNDGEAMLELGNLYAVGVDVDQDMQAAQEWWKKSAHTGNVEAASLLKHYSEQADKAGNTKTGGH